MIGGAFALLVFCIRAATAQENSLPPGAQPETYGLVPVQNAQPDSQPYGINPIPGYTPPAPVMPPQPASRRPKRFAAVSGICRRSPRASRPTVKTITAMPPCASRCRFPRLTPTRSRMTDIFRCGRRNLSCRNRRFAPAQLPTISSKRLMRCRMPPGRSPISLSQPSARPLPPIGWGRATRSVSPSSAKATFPANIRWMGQAWYAFP